MMDSVRVPKYVRVANLLQRRIGYGDYFLKGFPTDRDLSAEFEVDTRTARRAVAKLIEEGLLKRQANGRPAVVSVSGRKSDALRVAMLSVAYPTPFTARWQTAISHGGRVAGGRNHDRDGQRRSLRHLRRAQVGSL